VKTNTGKKHLYKTLRITTVCWLQLYVFLLSFHLAQLQAGFEYPLMGFYISTSGISRAPVDTSYRHKIMKLSDEVVCLFVCLFVYLDFGEWRRGWSLSTQRGSFLTSIASEPIHFVGCL
ncbi:mCG145457, partial [Mus musculus]